MSQEPTPDLSGEAVPSNDASEDFVRDSGRAPSLKDRGSSPNQLTSTIAGKRRSRRRTKTGCLSK